jgi:threonine/homoserine/homoserine lactone efflux protein
MGIELFLKGIVIGLMASIPLGPIGVLCIQRTLNKGRRAGFVSGLGASMADTFFALVAGYGISMIIAFLKAQHIYFQIIGGIIVMYLGTHIFFTNPIKQLRLQRMSQNKLSQDFLSVFFLTVSNPMAIFFFVAMFAGVNLASGPMNFFFVGLVVAGVFVGTSSWWFILTTTVNIFRHRFRLKSIWWLNKVSGVVIFFLGIAAILSVWFIK